MKIRLPVKLGPTLPLSAASVIVLAGCAALGIGGAPDARWADYKNWQPLHDRPITADHTGFLGGLHEGEQGVRRVFVNDIGFPVADGKGPYQYPIGTVIAKEQYPTMAAYEAGKKPGLTVMVKVSNDAANPADNWLWSRGYNREAKADSFCSGCHTVAAATDFAFSNATSLQSYR